MMIKRALSKLLSKRHSIYQDCFSDLVAVPILQKQDVESLSALFSIIPDSWDERYFYSLCMSRQFPIEKLVQWVRDEPNSADAYLIYGARLLKMAWNARGYGRGENIDKKKWKQFYFLLDETESTLLKAAELSPKDPTPWVYLIIAAVYRNAENSPEQDYFHEAIKRDPENWHAHMNMLTGLSKKYGGSHELMFDFVRTSAQNAPKDSLLNCLIFKAHSEYWKYKLKFEGNEEEAQEYQINQKVIDECLEVYNQTLATHEYEHYQSFFVRINAAGLFWILNQPEPLNNELLMLSNQLDDIHWRWVGTEGGLKYAKKFAVAYT